MVIIMTNFKKHLILTLFILIFAFSQISCAKNTETDQNSSPKTAENSVTISIYVEDEDRYVLNPVSVSIEENTTVFELLKKTTRENKIHMEFDGSDETAYVEGIDNLYAFDKGPESGWLFYVNEKEAEIGAGQMPVRPGDTVEWIYKTKMF